MCAAPHTHENSLEMIFIKDANFIFSIDIDGIVESEEVFKVDDDVNNVMVDAYKYEGKNLEKVWNLNLRDIENIGDEYIDAV